MASAYITATRAVLPGPPVDNEHIEDVLGRLGPEPSRLKAKILRNNGIKTRHYALDAAGMPTHDAAQLAAEAVRGLLAAEGRTMAEVELLACATALPEVVTPGLASLVHGELGGPPCEIVTTHAACCAGMTALKYAAMAVQTGSARTAVVAAVERASSLMRAAHFRAEIRARTEAEEANPYIAFDQEFLRWMLSDGAGAALVTDTPRPEGLSFRLEWIDLISYANELPTCMYMGARRRPDGGLRSWRDTPSLDESLRGGFFNLHQDVKLLAENIIATTIGRTLQTLRAKRRFELSDVDWVLPHYSSEFFRQKAYDELVRCDFEIPYERWASNLVDRGNTGSASVFIMLDDLVASGRVKRGDGLLLVVPESARFSAAWALLRAV